VLSLFVAQTEQTTHDPLQSDIAGWSSPLCFVEEEVGFCWAHPASQHVSVPMRLLIDSLVAVMLAALLAAIILSHRSDQERYRDVEVATLDLHRLQREIYLQAALGAVPLSERGFPVTVDPEWFESGLPRNPLLGPDHPWLEVAGAAQQHLTHPPQRMAADRSTAKFWYNPYQGVVRARISSELSEAEALTLYNQVNGCRLPHLFAEEPRTAPPAMQASAAVN
jgi:hypothetical protein